MIDALAFMPVRALRATLRGMEPARAVRIGAALGRATARLGGRVTRTARINLELAFPELSEGERARVLSDAYANVGRGVAELALMQGPGRRALLQAVRLEGAEHLAAAEAASPTGGVLVLSAHFGSWDLAAVAMAHQGQRISVVQRGFGSQRLSAMMSELRRAGELGVEEIAMGATAFLGVQRALRAGRKVVVLLDQNARRDEGVFVPFFSRLACTRDGPARIAARGGFPVVPAFVFREGDGAQHVVRVQPALDLAPVAGDREKAVRCNVAAMTQAIEEAILARPDHWLWSHRRWRTRPEASATGNEAESVYPAR